MDNEPMISKTTPESAGSTHPSVRQSNIELLRIIGMLLIVAHHFVVNSGLTDPAGPIAANPMSFNSIFLILFGMWGKIGTNCFVLITGYFMCKSRITAKKYVKLRGVVLFYAVSLYLIFAISGYMPFNLISLIKAIFPLYTVDRNFACCYLIFWLCIPFLNTLIAHLTERFHLYLLLILGYTYVLLGTAHTVTFNYVSWFCVLYFIASYIRFYPKRWMNKKSVCGALLSVSVVLSVASVFVCERIGLSSYAFVSDSNTLLAVLVGVFAFLFFKNMKLPYSKFINTVAASMFGVLCIHAHSDAMRQWLWKDTLDNVGHYGNKFMPLYAIGCVLGVFAICVIIDMIRIKLLEKPFFKWWDNHWDRISERFQKIERKVLEKLHVQQ